MNGRAHLNTSRRRLFRAGEAWLVGLAGMDLRTVVAARDSGSPLFGTPEGPTTITDPSRFPATFQEARQLAAMVGAGTLPSVADRIGQAAHETFRAACGVPEEEGTQLARKIWAILVDEVDLIGTVGPSPAAMGVRIIRTTKGQHPFAALQQPGCPQPRYLAAGDVLFPEPGRGRPYRQVEA